MYACAFALQADCKTIVQHPQFGVKFRMFFELTNVDVQEHIGHKDHKRKEVEESRPVAHWDWLQGWNVMQKEEKYKV
jgi:hypothetical protein